MTDQELNDFTAEILELMEKFNLTGASVEQTTSIGGKVTCKKLRGAGIGKLKGTEFSMEGPWSELRRKQ